MILLNVKSYGFDKIYMENELIGDTLYQIIDQFNKEKNYMHKVLIKTLK